MSHQKFIFWSIFCILMYGPNLSKNSLLAISFSLFTPFPCNTTLSRKTWNTSTFSMLVYYNTNSFFLVLKVSHLCTGLFSSLSRFQVFLSITSSFSSFIVSYCSSIWVPSNIASSDRLSRHGTSISRYA